MHTTVRRLGGTGLALATVLALGACDDDPVGNDEEHLDPVGLVVLNAGVEVLRVEGLNIIGSLTVAAGDETAHLDVEFIDEDGDRFVPTDPDEWLRVTVANPAIAAWNQDEAGEFGGHLEGLSAGTTTIGFDLMHGAVGSASAHADYRTPNVPVVVVD